MKKTKNFALHRKILVMALCIASLSLFFVNYANCQGASLNLTDIDDAFSEALGYSDQGFVGGIILTAIICALLVVPMIFIGSRYRSNGIIIVQISMLFIGLVVGVALEWVSYWILLMVALLVSVLFAGNIRDWVSGR